MYRVTLKSLFNINKMVRKQEEPLPATISIIGKFNFTFRDKVFPHAVVLVEDESNSTYNILLINGICAVLDIMSISFKDLEYIEYRFSNKRVKLSMDNTNRL